MSMHHTTAVSRPSKYHEGHLSCHPSRRPAYEAKLYATRMAAHMFSSGLDSTTSKTDGSPKASPVNQFRLRAMAPKAPHFCCIDLALRFQRGIPYECIYNGCCEPADVQPASSRPYSHQEALCILQSLIRKPHLCVRLCRMQTLRTAAAMSGWAALVILAGLCTAPYAAGDEIDWDAMSIPGSVKYSGDVSSCYASCSKREVWSRSGSKTL